ncbi:adenylate/guanylate cyclase domain-containing protein [Nocardioides litoris]|uniref:adenylate/guanylate cyclase domain-containing protein n=1 Tax=Nocardioides litoris TaxID=1926648 RepID=UPI001FE5FDC7|nr:adenylate/guanylate cyclase domain-containing protein [Nocardioides litoris]
MTALAVAVALAVALGIAVGVLVGMNRRQQQRIEEQAERIEQLEADLSAALRPRPASTATERAVRRVVKTATRVREQGLGGLLASSIDDLQAWAESEQQDIVTMADVEGRVTLVFSDIEDSTPLNERLGDDTWVRVLAAHDQLVRQRVERYRGQVVKGFGDGFMLAFRDAEAACRAARGIQKDLRRTLDPRLRVVAPLKVRIGIHTGPVVTKDGDYFGRNVAMAARVGALATGGEVLVTSEVVDALDDDAAVELTEMGEVELKGLPGTHQLFRLRTR